MTASLTRRLAGALAFSALVAGSAALAHHGWDWAEEAQSTLEGKIGAISMAPPHPTLQVVAKDGTWQVDLGNPNQTERSGFRGDSAKAGDAVTVLGNRHRDKAKRQMKAVRITLSGKTYDMYPERIGAK